MVERVICRFGRVSIRGCGSRGYDVGREKIFFGEGKVEDKN